MDIRTLTELGRSHIQHPHSSIADPAPAYPVKRADGVTITLKDGRRLLDGMSSWWVTVHGYSHPCLNRAAVLQPEKMSHIMFNGFTHDAAAKLTQTLLDILPSGLDTVFYTDSGSVAVEVAIRMAVQYQHALGVPRHSKSAALRADYHGDTWHAMSVCDPVTGMHSLFAERLPVQFFLPQPPVKSGEPWREEAVAPLTDLLDKHGGEIATLIVEPVVRRAGGMYFYAPECLRRAQALCREHGVLLILNEIAAGFGYTGKLFACERADVMPDIMCLSRALTDGYLTLSATVTHKNITDTVSSGAAGCFMYGSTLMANPLACVVADESVKLLVEDGWRENVTQIKAQLRETLAPARGIAAMKEVYVLGAIGAVGMWKPVSLRRLQPKFVERDVWPRPFGKLVYTISPFITQSHELDKLSDGLIAVLKEKCGG